MSNMRKSFETKAKLRHMANGGVFKSIVNGVPTFTDKDRAAPDAKAYVPTAMRELPNTGIVPGGTALPQAPAAPMPAPAKLSVAPAAPMPAPAKLSVAPAPAITAAPPRAGMTAPPVPAAPQQFHPQDPYSKMTGKQPVPITPRTVRIPMNYMAQTGGFGPTTVPERRPRAIGSMRKEIGAERQDIGMGYLAASGGFMASGGEVKGPGGPTDDKVGPVMLSDGEYVLPADTVRKVGKENLDALKDATHTPVSVKQRRGLRRMADGTPTEEQKRAAMLRAAAQTAAGPTAAMVATGTPSAQPMPPQRPSEVLSGNVDLGVMRNDGVPPPPPAAPKLTQVPRTVLMGPGEALIRGLTGDAVLGTASKPPTQTPAAPNAEELYRASGNVGSTPASPDTTAAPAGPDSLPPTAWEDGDEALTGLTERQSDELRHQGVSMNSQYAAPRKMKFGDPVDRGAIDRPMVATGEKQINSKFYRDTTGAVKEGTATLFRPATEEDINKMPLNIGPRAFSNLTLREGTEPGQQVNLGNGMFGTSSGLNKDGRLDTFTGVGKDYNADSARFGPDPNGADRARQDAIVEQNLQAKPREVRGPRMPEFRSNERDINTRFDQLAKEAQRNFSSPRAAGNLTKALERIEASRMQALSQDADNITRQQQIQSSSAATDRELASREAQAARADETDRLTIASQDQRAASAAAQTGVLADREFDRKNYEIAVKNKQFSGTYNDWVAYGGSWKQGGGQPYVNVKDIERNTKRVTDRVTQMFPEDPAAQANVIANARLFWGAPDAAVAAYAPIVNSIAQKLGRPDIGLPQLSDDGKETWDASAADLQKGSDNWWTDTRASLWDGDGPAYKFVTDGGEEIFIAKSRLSAPEQRFLQSYLQSSKPKKERD